jgi:hypothetical protein
MSAHQTNAKVDIKYSKPKCLAKHKEIHVAIKATHPKTHLIQAGILTQATNPPLKTIQVRSTQVAPKTAQHHQGGAVSQSLEMKKTPPSRMRSAKMTGALRWS